MNVGLITSETNITVRGGDTTITYENISSMERKGDYVIINRKYYHLATDVIKFEKHSFNHVTAVGTL